MVAGVVRISGSKLSGMNAVTLRVFGDPVLRDVAEEVQDIDAKLVELTHAMADEMYAAAGLGIAAPQVGIRKRLFVYDMQDGKGPLTIVNPVIKESSGEWTYDEGCLSVPGLSWEIIRPREIHMTGYDLDGNEVSIDGTDLFARLCQHELDHLDGVLLLDKLPDDQRAEGMKILRNRILEHGSAHDPARTGRVDRVAAEPVAKKRGLSLPGLPGLR
jgi:peptide deformylase